MVPTTRSALASRMEMPIRSASVFLLAARYASMSRSVLSCSTVTSVSRGRSSRLVVAVYHYHVTFAQGRSRINTGERPGRRRVYAENVSAHSKDGLVKTTEGRKNGS